MTASKVFFYFCLSFIGGIFLNSFFDISQVILFVFLIIGIMFISIFWQNRNLKAIGFCFLFLVLGIWRHETIEIKSIESELQRYNDKKETVILTGTVSNEPDVRDSHIKLTINKIIFSENENQFIDGKILITTDRYPEYKYGDRIKIKGKLETPQIFDDFNYKDYLRKDGIYSVIYYPEIELIEKNQGNFIYAGILNFKNRLRKNIYQNLSPPQSSFLAAMILGDKRQISEEWKEKLNYAGVRHLTAISGMHVAILTVILMSLLVSLGFWRQQAFYLTIILIGFFIAMTGFQPSAVRAGIMAGFFLLAQYLGRINISVRAIVFAAVLMLIFNPLLLKLDIGFQLSFLAMLGIIYFLPIFQFLLRKFPDFLQGKEIKISSSPISVVRELKNVFSMTISAQIFTLPILIYNFGYLSVVSFFTNVLLVPFLPFIMGLGFIFVLIGTVSRFLAWVISFPLWFILSYLTKIVDFFSGFSFSAYFFEISWLWILIYYLFLAIFVWQFNKKQKMDFLN